MPSIKEDALLHVDGIRLYSLRLDAGSSPA